VTAICAGTVVSSIESQSEETKYALLRGKERHVPLEDSAKAERMNGCSYVYVLVKVGDNSAG